MKEVRILRRRDVLARTGISKTKLYQLIAAGEFPPPVRLTTARVGWPSNEIDTWISKRIAESRGNPEAAA